MSRLRILVVDDSATVRRILVELLSAEPGFEVTAVASGKLALARIELQKPDAVVLDLEMPEMDGLECLRRIRVSHPRLPIVMFSTHTERGARATLDALFLGASDYVTKPSGTDAIVGRDAVILELRRKIQALCPEAAPLPPLPSALASAPLPVVRTVVIGASTGGPNALATLVSALPSDLPAPIAIVQHMPPMFTRLLAESLAARSAIRVAEATDGAILSAGTVTIAQGGRHLRLESAGRTVRAVLDDGHPENSSRPSVDTLFRSAATAFGAGTLGVVLTGMGQDGLRGSMDIRAAGGRVIAQDQASSVVWGMPGFVVREGLADVVLPIERIAAEITRRVGTRASTAEAAR